LSFIDSNGWNIISKYGLYPTVLVGPNPKPYNGENNEHNN